MLPDEHYICQSAANAIISQVGPLRISSDALQAVNQFLDEFIQLLVIQLEHNSSSILGLSLLKQACYQLLPNMLGKNAVVEAELEVKNMVKPESFKHVLPFLRKQCLEQCTLADKTKQNSNTEHPGAVVVYVTAIVEHVGEHVLTCIATTADDQQDTEYVRIKDVFFALIEDAQLSLLFGRMDLHDKIEKRVGRSISINNSRPRSCYLPMANTTQNNLRYTTLKRNSVVEINFDDLDLEYFEEDNGKNSKRYTAPQISQQQQQQQQQQQKRTCNKKRAAPRVQSVYLPNKPIMNFDDLIKSNNTVKVSLTPNRLKSIEVKDHRKEDDTESWLRRRSSTTFASIKRLASNIRPNSSPVKPACQKKKKKEEEEDESKEAIRKKGEEQGSIKRPASTPPIHHHHHPQPREKENKPFQRSRSPLSMTSSILEISTSSLLDDNSNIQINATTIIENNNTSYMSIPSLSLSDISKSHHSTSSLASTLSSNSVLRELSSTSIEKAEERKSCAIISSPPSIFPSIDSNISKLIEQHYLVDDKKIPIENKQQQEEKEEGKEKGKEEMNHLQQPTLPEQQVIIEETSLQTATKQQQPERPSSIVARRAYRLGNSRPKSFHENQATEKYLKQFHKESDSGDDRKKTEITRRTSNLVLDKVLKFELGSTYEPPKKSGERFVYFQQQNPTSSQKRTSVLYKCPVDQAVQTDAVVEEEEEEEVGVIDGDEEWFIKDDELDEQDESDIVNWLLGE